MRHSIALAWLLLVLPATARAGAWVPQRGDGYVKTWAKWHWGFWDYVDGEGTPIPFGPYHEVFASTYGEVGLGRGIAVTWHSDLVRGFVLGDPRTGESTGHVAPGDPRVGLRVQLLQAGRLVVAAEGGLLVPLASDQPVQTVFARDDPQPEIGQLRVGAGIVEADVSAAFGYGWNRAYVGGALGWELRTSGFDDRLFWNLEGGVRIGARGSTRLRASGVHSVLDEGRPPADSPSGIGNGTSWTGLAVEADVALGRLDRPVRWTTGLTAETGLTLVTRRSGGTTTSWNLAASF